MWDLFNKIALEKKAQELQKKQQAIEEQTIKIHQLENENKMKQQAIDEQTIKIQQLENESKMKQQAIDEAFIEFRQFILQNRDNIKNYECLNLTKNLIDDVADLHDYVIELSIRFTEYGVQSFRIFFHEFLNKLPGIKSYRFDLEQPIKLSSRINEYRAVIHITSINELKSVDNNLSVFLFGLKVIIDSHKIIDNNKIIVTGNKNYDGRF
jgi:hypothetical protein